MLNFRPSKAITVTVRGCLSKRVRVRKRMPENHARQGTCNLLTERMAAEEMNQERERVKECKE